MSERMDVQVRAGGEGDLTALTDIYNHYIRETPITFDINPITPDERRPWLLSHPEDGPHRLLVAQSAGDGRVLGYATSSPFRPKAAYATSVETSIYLAPGSSGRGVGTLLYTALFEALAGEDVHRAYAGVTLPNEASIRIHRRFGFQQIGVYEEVGRKFGAYHDVAWLEKRLS
ncbi:GNAT family N-acetyltransferase [Actinacidiphila bryophytorum]|uniref:Phosphinothricin N-acetyltransferase n=1 Tax=Actinacidiphila bryophytorum TaxID=1436133 RepID=A0A9W4H0L0_9ACTN|nr:GNAT family N-acetyltransferase [Actinacidiphila bryophytorum]MBM9438786.1 N-acetyltransferase [Actinacidiphila bryophytorum]MBN6541858.1 N-acetyltransferase [Actinacidiphila bryophytorum]CAG7638280.1 Phosphinothricin N-acetyltransferase [Actinacidiphila bryophytorum]